MLYPTDSYYSQKISEKYLKNLRNKKIFPNLKPGLCIIHHCKLSIHGSKDNRSNSDRIGLVISYKGKSCKHHLKNG